MSKRVRYAGALGGLSLLGGSAAWATPLALLAQADSTQKLINIPGIWYLVPIASIVGLVAAFGFYRQMLAAPAGNERMREIAGLRPRRRVRLPAAAVQGRVSLLRGAVAVLLWVMSH
jgi:hypothetical protein